MENNKESGFVALATKSLTVITAALAALMPNHSKAALTPTTTSEAGNEKLTFGEYQKRVLKSKLVLKINPRNPDRFVFAQHRSHSSHSSHASHSSHYSSSPSYTPSTPKQTPTPDATTNPTTLTEYTLGSRLLFNGCEGTDVKELQEILLALKYDVVVSGYFGDKTSEAVKKFQKAHELKPTATVDDKTLTALRKK